MSTDRQRDADMDRLLRARLRREAAVSPGSCPDAGLLAACVEGAVSSEERIALEAHLASCGRCQDVLAALELDLPAPPTVTPAAVPRRPWLWRGHLHWLIPVGAATALVVYVASRPAIAPTVPQVGGVSTEMAELRAPEPPVAAAPAAPGPAAPGRTAAAPAVPTAAPSPAARDRASDAAAGLRAGRHASPADRGRRAGARRACHRRPGRTDGRWRRPRPERRRDEKRREERGRRLGRRRTDELRPGRTRAPSCRLRISSRCPRQAARSAGASAPRARSGVPQTTAGPGIRGSPA